MLLMQSEIRVRFSALRFGLAALSKVNLEVSSKVLDDRYTDLACSFEHTCRIQASCGRNEASLCDTEMNTSQQVVFRRFTNKQAQ